ncbi:hypothetical protein RYX36_020655 [Vicia faba]
METTEANGAKKFGNRKRGGGFHNKKKQKSSQNSHHGISLKFSEEHSSSSSTFFILKPGLKLLQSFATPASSIHNLTLHFHHPPTLILSPLTKSPLSSSLFIYNHHFHLFTATFSSYSISHHHN